VYIHHKTLIHRPVGISIIGIILSHAIISQPRKALIISQKSMINLKRNAQSNIVVSFLNIPKIKIKSTAAFLIPAAKAGSHAIDGFELTKNIDQ
jgi:hypothetical protein